jgi:hypothetical protein
VKASMKLRNLAALVCAPLALVACNDAPGDGPQKPKVAQTVAAAAPASEPLRTGPAGTAYPVPSISASQNSPAGGAQGGAGAAVANPAATNPGAAPAGAANPGAAPPTSPAAAAPGTVVEQGTGGANPAAKDAPTNAPGSGELTAEEEKNQMPMPGQVHNYSGDARKAGQNEATPTGKNDDAASGGEKPGGGHTAAPPQSAR